MKIIPAIDLQSGDCVRLLKGKKQESTRYSSNPVEMARHWVKKGAERLHIVDLDGAFEEPTENKEVIESILDEVSIPCQVGGGLRSQQAVDDVLSAGADAVIVGTAGIKDPDLLSSLVKEYDDESIIAGVDCRNDKVLVRGWEEESQYKRDEWIQQLENIGIRKIVYTEVSRDGTEEGPDVKGTEDLLERFSLNVIASGGVGSLEHLKELRSIKQDNLSGVIIGRALYERSFSLGEAKKVLQ